MLPRLFKEYLTFNRREKNGIIVLLSILFAVALIPGIWKQLYTSPNIEKVDIALELELLAEQLDVQNPGPLEFFDFDPNTATEKELLSMGLSPRQVSNIKNYLAAGGVYRTPEDLLRMYTIDTALFTVLEPWIQISGEKQQTGFNYVGDSKREEEITGLNIELNSADENQLMQLRGIGPVYSSRIVSYRELLGGYTSPSQLTEVYGIDEELYLQVKPYLYADTGSIRKICLNEAGFVTLLRHPYLDYEQVSALFRYRDTAGVFRSVKELKLLSEFSEDDVNRLSEYLVINM